MMSSNRILCAWVSCIGLGVSGCGGGASGDKGASSDLEGAESSADLPTPLPARIAVTADFKAQSLSVLDQDALLALSGASATRDEVLVRHVDLSDWAPGPLEVEVIPNTHEAIVAVGPGFFGGIVGGLIEAGEVDQGGALLHVDLESGEVLASLDRPIPPMGIAISPDGTRAYVADYGNESVRGDTVTVLDLSNLSVTQTLIVGAGPEQIALNSDGSLAAVNAASAGTIRIFSTADPAGTLSAPLVVSDDPSWVHFVEGEPLLVVTNSAGPATWSVVDLSDPTTPVLRENGENISGFPYALAPIPNSSDYLFTSMTFGRFSWHRVDVSQTPSQLVSSHERPDITVFPLGIALSPDGQRVLAPLAGDNALVVFGVDDESWTRIEWVGAPGPTYVTLAGN